VMPAHRCHVSINSTTSTITHAYGAPGITADTSE
jgi:hypothetical protein